MNKMFFKKHIKNVNTKLFQGPKNGDLVKKGQKTFVFTIFFKGQFHLIMKCQASLAVSKFATCLSKCTQLC